MNLFMLWVILLISILVGLVVSDWMLLILVMEITLFTFIFMSYEYKFSGQSAICVKYFFVQTLGSILLLVSGLLMVVLESAYKIMIYMVISGMGLKLGMFPMHFWVLPVNLGLPYMLMGVLGSPMKVLPLSLFMSFYKTIGGFSTLLMVLGASSMVAGLFLGLSSPSVRGVLGASSITHTGWFLFSMISFDMLKYFILYSVSLLLVVWSLMYSNSLVSISMLMLSGFPPFSVFTGKLVVVMNLLSLNQPISFVVVALATSVFSLFYYLKFAFNFYLLEMMRGVNFWMLGPAIFLFNFFCVFFFLLFFYGRDEEALDF